MKKCMAIVKLPKSRPGNFEYFKLLGWKCDLYGLERKISLVAIKCTLSNFQNPRWQPSVLDFCKIFNFYSRWTRESSNTTLYGSSSAAEPFLKLVMQFGHQNTRWPPKWPPKYLTFNLDGLESHLIPHLWIIKGCKTISEVGFIILSTGSKMGANIIKTGLIAKSWLLWELSSQSWCI